MRCDEAAPRLEALEDGELSGAERSALEAHVAGCRACAGRVGDIGRLGAMVWAARMPAQPGLADRVRAALADEAGRSRVRAPLLPGLRWRPAPGPAWIGAGFAACLLTAVLTWAGLGGAAAPDRAIHDALTAHLRGIAQDRLVQVASSDSHTVKPWFGGRIEFAPSVKDLSAEGFPLVGGRIDFVDGERVAALVYRRRLHIVTVLMRPDPKGGSSSPAPVRRRGYTVLAWSAGGVAYWAVSDVNAADLVQLKELL